MILIATIVPIALKYALVFFAIVYSVKLARFLYREIKQSRYPE